MRGARAPVVRSENLLGDGRWLSTLRSGLPVRLHYRVEVWRSRNGWFDSSPARSTGTWCSGTSRCWTSTPCSHLRQSGTGAPLRHARRAQRRARLRLPGERESRPAGNYYYAASLEVSTLSDSDLDELERFLEGDLTRRRAREDWATRWAEERRGSCCGWPGCRVCGWRPEHSEGSIAMRARWSRPGPAAPPRRRTA